MKAVDECSPTGVLSIGVLNYRAKGLYPVSMETVALMHDFNGAKLVREVPTQSSKCWPSNNWVFSSDDNNI